MSDPVVHSMRIEFAMPKGGGPWQFGSGHQRGGGGGASPWPMPPQHYKVVCSCGDESGIVLDAQQAIINHKLDVIAGVSNITFTTP